MRRPAKKLSFRLENHVNSYALAASAAGVSLLALAKPCEAKIVYTPAHTKIREDTPVWLSLNHDRAPDLSFIWASFSSAGMLGLWVSPTVPNGVVGYRGTGVRVFDASALKGGVLVGPKDKFVPSSANHVQMWVGYLTDGGGTDSHGQWRDVNHRYIGVKFSARKKTHYGWVRLNVMVHKIGYGIDAVVTGYAYETIPNRAIIAGKTHGKDVVTVQPASLGALAAGANGLHTWRQK